MDLFFFEKRSQRCFLGACCCRHARLARLTSSLDEKTSQHKRGLDLWPAPRRPLKLCALCIAVSETARHEAEAAVAQIMRVDRAGQHLARRLIRNGMVWMIANVSSTT